MAPVRPSPACPEPPPDLSALAQCLDGLAEGDAAWAFTLLAVLGPGIDERLRVAGIAAVRRPSLIAEVVVRISDRLADSSPSGDPMCWVGEMVDEVLAHDAAQHGPRAGAG